MKSKILIIFVVFFIGLGIWGYPILKNRYFGRNSGGSVTNYEAKQDVGVESSVVPDTANVAPENTQQYQSSEPQSKNVTSDDCDNECVRVKDDPGDLAYCQEICGLSPAPAQSTGNCSDKSGINKDYCLKDEAVSKKSFTICDQIEDLGIKKTCQNRITEDLIESQGPVE